MPRRSAIDPLQDLIAAYLSLVEGLPHKEVLARIRRTELKREGGVEVGGGKPIGVTPVTRALDRAAENGWILRQQIFVREKVPAKLFLKMTQALGMAPRLLHRLRSP